MKFKPRNFKVVTMNKSNAATLGILALLLAFQNVHAAPDYRFYTAAKSLKVQNSPSNPGTAPLPDAGNSLPSVSIEPKSLTFTPVFVGQQSEGKPVRITNTSNAPVSLTSVTLGTGSDYRLLESCGSISAGAYCDVLVSFTPSQGQVREDVLSLDFDFGKVTNVALSGSGKLPSVTLSTPVFADAVYPDQTLSTATVRLTNDSPDALAILARPSALGNNITPRGSFFVQSSTCSGTIMPGGTCDTVLRMGTTTAGARTGTFSISTAAGTKQVALSGTVYAGIASFTPGNLDFKGQAVGTTSTPQQITLTNTGNRPLTVTGVSVTTGASEFGQSNNCATILEVGQFCNIDVAYTPLKAEYQIGTVSVTHTGAGYTGFSMSGTGVALPVVRFLTTSITAGGDLISLYYQVDANTSSFSIKCSDNLYLYKGEYTQSVSYSYGNTNGTISVVSKDSAGVGTCTITNVNNFGSFSSSADIDILPKQ